MPTENPFFAEKEKTKKLDLTELLFFNVLHRGNWFVIVIWHAPAQRIWCQEIYAAFEGYFIVKRNFSYPDFWLKRNPVSF